MYIYHGQIQSQWVLVEGDQGVDCMLIGFPAQALSWATFLSTKKKDILINYDYKPKVLVILYVHVNGLETMERHIPRIKVARSFSVLVLRDCGISSDVAKFINMIFRAFRWRLINNIICFTPNILYFKLSSYHSEHRF